MGFRTARRAKVRGNLPCVCRLAGGWGGGGGGGGGGGVIHMRQALNLELVEQYAKLHFFILNFFPFVNYVMLTSERHQALPTFHTASDERQGGGLGIRLYV